MQVFVYPKSRHVRTQTPFAYSDYSRFKPALQTEFGRRCVYCREPDSIRGSNTFGVDHYRPKAHFSALSNEYLNLYYCCNTCNTWKSDYWPWNREATRFIPNPCDHEMFRHMRYLSDGSVEGRTEAGIGAVETLHLNDDRTVKWRASIDTVVEMLRGNESRALRILSNMAQKLKAGTISAAKEAADAAKTSFDLQRTRDALATFGEAPLL